MFGPSIPLVVMQYNEKIDRNAHLSNAHQNKTENKCLLQFKEIILPPHEILNPLKIMRQFKM